MNNYTVYHLHSELSLLDSCTNFKLYVDKAVELGQKAICFSEHGNIYNKDPLRTRKLLLHKNEHEKYLYRAFLFEVLAIYLMAYHR